MSGDRAAVITALDWIVILSAAVALVVLVAMLRRDPPPVTGELP